MYNKKIHVALGLANNHLKQVIPMKCITLLLGVACTFATELRADVLLVGAPSGGFTQINDAVQAAQDGDVILVWNGTYSPVSIVNKTLVIEPAEQPAAITIVSTFSIQDLASSRSVQIRGIKTHRLSVLNCLGPVRIENYRPISSGLSNGGSFTNCSSVTILDSNLLGSGHGLTFDNSLVSVFNVDILGGLEAGSFGWTNGADGVVASGTSHVFWSAGSATGGEGDGFLSLSQHTCGIGGHGVVVHASATFEHIGGVFAGGSGGSFSCGNGLPIIAPNGISRIQAAPRYLSASPVIFDNAEIGMRFDGVPGDAVSYSVSEAPAHVQGPEIGPTLVANPVWIAAGTIPSSGVLHVTHTMPGLPMQMHTVVHCQGRIDTGSDLLMTNPTWTTVIGRGLDFCEVLMTRLGQEYCAPNSINSTGLSSRLVAVGSHCVSNNNVSLRAYDIPLQRFGFLLSSSGQGFAQNPGGSSGNLCLGGTGAIGRHNSIMDTRNSGPQGAFEVTVDLTQIPSIPSTTMILPGQAWNFQAWHRDGASSNFTNAVRIVFH